MTTKRKIIAAVILAVTVISGAGTGFWVFKTSLENNLEEKYSIIASSIYDSIENEISNTINTSLTMAKNEFLISLLKNEGSYTEKDAVEQVSSYLASVKNVLGAQTAFLVSKNTGRYYSYDGLNKIINPDTDEHDVWFPIFVNSRKPYDLDVDVDQVNGNNWTVFINARVEDENKKLLGVCGIGMSMQNLQELLQRYEGYYPIKVNFINSDGLIQVDTDAVNIENAYLHDIQYGKEKDGYTYKNSTGDFVVMRYVERLNWYLVIHGKDNVLSAKEVLPVFCTVLIIIVLNILALFLLDKSKPDA